MKEITVGNTTTPALVGSVPLVGSPFDSRYRSLALCSSAEARKAVPLSIAEKLSILPISLIDDGQGHRVLSLIVPPGFSYEQAQVLRFASDGAEISLEEEADEQLLKKAIQAAYVGHTVEPAQSVSDLFDTILRRGIALQGSDIHFEPYASTYRVRYRVDGVLRHDQSFTISAEEACNVVRRIKVLARLDHTEQGSPQEGGFHFTYGIFSHRLRVSILPTALGEKAVLRILDHFAPGDDNEVRSSTQRAVVFNGLGLDSEQERLLIAYLGLDAGVILAVGPTGCGKSTLLYAALTYLNDPTRHIVTVEDPVERRVHGVSQTEVNRKNGLDYPQLLAPLLRQDPDVIMVGEIRDRDTAQMALTAGLTGHLILGTLHATNCIEGMIRLRQLGIDRDLLCSSLRLLISQRLLGLNCPECVYTIQANGQISEAINLPKSAQLRTARGCKNCGFTGVLGRIAVFEFLRITDNIRLALAKDRDISLDLVQLRALAREAGYLPYAFAVRDKLLQGLVSPSSALRSLGLAPELFGY